MRFTVRDDQSEETIYGITLEGGYKPCISSVKSLSIPDIEPAIWYKTLVLKGITVDCVDKNLYYTVSEKEETAIEESVEAAEIPPQSDIPNKQGDNRLKHAKKAGDTKKADGENLLKRIISESELQEDRFHSGQVGELFQISNKALLEFRKTGETLYFYENVLQILHCFILPVILFSKPDIHYLNTAIEEEEAIITTQNQKIEAQQLALKKIEQQMFDIREKVCKTLIPVYNECVTLEKAFRPKLQISHGIVEILTKDFDKDIKKMSSNLDSAQTRVDVILAKIQQSNDTTSSIVSNVLTKNSGLLKTQLNLERQKRDEMHKRRQDLLIANELLKNYSINAKKKKKLPTTTKATSKPVISEHDGKLYIELEPQRDSIRNKMRELVMNKVLMISVREAITSTVKELRDSKGESNGGLHSKSGVGKCTDVLFNSLNPKQFQGIPSAWKTIEECIHSILIDREQDIAGVHHDTLAVFIFRCECIITRLTSKQPNGTILCNESVSAINNLSKDIVKHMIKICTDLQQHSLNNCNFIYIWECFEKVFFAKLGSVLKRTYKLALKNKLDDISRWIKEITAESLGEEFKTSLAWSLLEGNAFCLADGNTERVDNCNKKSEDEHQYTLTNNKCHSRSSSIPCGVLNLSFEQKSNGTEQKLKCNGATPLSLQLQDTCGMSKSLPDNNIHPSLTGKNDINADGKTVDPKCLVKDYARSNQTEHCKLMTLNVNQNYVSLDTGVKMKSQTDEESVNLLRTKSIAEIILNPPKQCTSRNRSATFMIPGEDSAYKSTYSVKNLRTQSRKHSGLSLSVPDNNMRPPLTGENYINANGRTIDRLNLSHLNKPKFLNKDYAVSNRTERCKTTTLNINQNHVSRGTSENKKSQADELSVNLLRKKTPCHNRRSLTEIISNLPEQCLASNRSATFMAADENCNLPYKSANSVKNLRTRVRKLSREPSKYEYLLDKRREELFSASSDMEWMTLSCMMDKSTFRFKQSVVSCVKDVKASHPVEKSETKLENLTPKILKLRPEVLKDFHKVMALLKELCSDETLSTPTEKLQIAFRVLQELELTARRYLEAVSTDDIIDLLVVLICNLDVELLQLMYLNVEMMVSLSPDFYSLGQFGYVMTTFSLVWHYLFEQFSELKKGTLTFSSSDETSDC